MWLWKLTSPKIAVGQLEAQDSRQCAFTLSWSWASICPGLRPRKSQYFNLSPKVGKNQCLSWRSSRRCSQTGQCLSWRQSSKGFFLLGRVSFLYCLGPHLIRWGPPTLGMPVCFSPNPLIQEFFSTRNSLTDKPRIMLTKCRTIPRSKWVSNINYYTCLRRSVLGSVVGVGDLTQTGHQLHFGGTHSLANTSLQTTCQLLQMG